MPKYTSRDNVKSGVPLGGIGAGKMEIMPNGSINHITFQNNWSEPLVGGKAGVLGFHFAVYTEAGKKRTAKFLQTSKIDSFPLIDSIEYDGSFPFARLKYKDKKIPLDIDLLSFSPFIPRNEKDSSIPGACFKFKFKNPTDKTIRASLLVMGRNTIGNWGVGRSNVVSKDKKQLFLTFKNGRREPLRNDFSLGNMTMSVPLESGEISYLGEWNLMSECFRLKEHTLRLDAWEYFSKLGRLPNINTKKVVEGESQELGGAIAIKFVLKPGQVKEIPLIYSWYFPTHTVGHIYTKWFKDSRDVSRYISRECERLYKQTSSWHKKILSSGMPPWFTDALVNNLYPLFSSTWHGRKGEFVMYEAPVVCPLMGTIDVRFYGSIPVSFLFPELDLTAMKQFAAAQRKDGYIPHDLGKKRIDLPSDGTTYYKWKDLCSKFVLLCYRDYLVTKNKRFLKKIYPNIKRAMEWQFAQDKNRDFLPDDEGQDQTFDMWNFYGTNSYTSSIFLAALLASIKIANTFKDKKHEMLYKKWFENGKRNFEKKLWNQRYFVNYLCNDKGCESSCTIGQLNGQWYAHLLGLGYIADKKKVKTAIKTILRLNGTKSKHGLVNAVRYTGEINKSSFHSKNVFPGMSYAFASLCIYEGFKKEGMSLTKRIWDNFAYNTKTPWNQPDVVHLKTGKGLFGDYYMRNMGIWSVYLALANRDSNLRKTLKTITR
ncbi:MAG: hypothetical protein HQ575_06930 [Candidatus Omnitrophica bacterium]|nr:hypothetical protein [Candidatus Omnitrophota bacterium]